MDLSIVIVNYNTAELLLPCLQSIYRYNHGGLSLEVWVVDNHSTDDSVKLVREQFPQVKLICSATNDGFARANNAALRQCSGEYLLALNPDTVVMEDTFTKMMAFMRMHPEAGAVTCKVIKADGRLDAACKRSFPTVWNAFCKMLGLDRITMRLARGNGANRLARLCGGYNLTYLDENQTHTVESIVGAFMLMPAQVAEEVGYFDERFFMYGEDIDLCYRIMQAGYRNYYCPEAYIIHYKGESSKKQSTRMIGEFHRAMIMYYDKHHAARYPFFVNWAVYAAVYCRWGLVLSANCIKKDKRVSK